MKLYEALAADIETSIRTGLLRPGEKLPSVRHTARTRSVSVSTVFQAYYLLEARALVRARERAGYFVSPAASGVIAPLTSLSQPPDQSLPVDVSSLIFEILMSTRTRKVIPLGSAFPSPALFPLARLSRSLSVAARKADAWASVDDMSPGSETLRRQIAQRYAADGYKVGVDEIVVTNGAMEALNLCLAAVTRPGDTVIVECPVFYGALQAIERMGLRVVQVPTHAHQGIDLCALENAIKRHKPKACWFMTTFQNPLGCSMPVERKKELVQILARHQLPMIEDDVYGELFFGQVRPPPAKAFDTEGLVMHCSSFSKTLAPGYRIGWAAPGRFAKLVARQKLTFSLSASIPAQLAISDYLKGGGFDKHLRGLRTALALQQEAFMLAMACSFPPDTKATRPEGGYFVWVELPARVDALLIHKQAAKLGISIAPGPIFSPAGKNGNCLRLNYGHPGNAVLYQAIETLGGLIRKASSRA